MNEKKSTVQEVLDAFKKTNDDLKERIEEEKRNAVRTQIENLRKDVKDLQDEASRPGNPAGS